MSTPKAAPATPNPADQIARVNRFAFRIAKKNQENLALMRAIDEHLNDRYGIDLPARKPDLTEEWYTLFKVDTHGDKLYSELEQLVKLRYALGTTRGFYAEFTDQATGQVSLQAQTFWYSRHRLDAVWNMRKSQIIRARYYSYLQTATDETGALLTEKYQPMHLTLTLPHKDGLYKGKRFFSTELIEAYKKLRATPVWKYIYAGEYGVEVKKSKEHGLHIHIHSFLLQHPGVSVNAVRELLAYEWKKITGNTSGYSGMHYESLYVYQKDANGKLVLNRKGEPVKDYITPGRPLDDYLAGVMECVKYHFKPGCLEKDANGEFGGTDYDIELIQEILNNTFGKRLYSRFGAFFKEKSLSFNLDNDKGEPDTDQEEEILASADDVEERTVNPLTGQPATRDEYEIVVVRPHMLRYREPDSPRPYEPYYTSRAAAGVQVTPPGIGLKDAIKLQVKGLLLNMATEHIESHPPSHI